RRRIRQPPPVRRERWETLVGTALEKQLRCPGFESAAFLGQRHGPQLLASTKFDISQASAVRRERPRILDYLALRHRLWLARTIRASLDDAVANGREDHVTAVGAPYRRAIDACAEGQSRHDVPLGVVNEDVLTPSLRNRHRHASAIRRQSEVQI